MTARPPADGDLLYGALLGLFTALLLSFGLWALSEPLPELLPGGALPERLVVVWSSPPSDRPTPPERAPTPEGAPAGQPGRGPLLPPEPVRDAAGRAAARESIDTWLQRIGLGGAWEEGATQAEWEAAVAATEGWRGPIGPTAQRGASDGSGSGDRSVGRVGRLGGGSVAVSAMARAAPRGRALPPLEHPRRMPALVTADGRRVPVEAPPQALTRDVLRARRRDIQDCRDRAARERPGLAGRVTLRLGVLGGRVAAVEVTEDTLGAPMLAQCLARRARSWRFPDATTGTLSLPLAFTGN